MSSHNFTRRLEQTGFALVITLILVAVVAVIVVGFLGHAVNDRATAATGGERFRAELAAQSGLEAAKKALAAMSPAPTPGSTGTSKIQNDYFTVTTSNDISVPPVPYYFIGSPDGGTQAAPTVQYYPLYSGGTAKSGVLVSSSVPSPTFTGTRAQQTIGTKTINYPRLFSSAPHSTWQPNINTSWQTVDNTIPTTSEHTRYTYWIEDLAGYVDANVAGNTDGTGSTHIRSLGYDPKEIALFTLFNTAQSDPSGTWGATLVGNHPIVFTPWTTRVGGTASSASDQTCLASLVANLPTDAEQNIIPYGLGYKNQGQLKTNLNQIVSDVASGARTSDDAIYNAASATKPSIGRTISDNLPNFASTRQGGLLSSEGYLETLAANMIGYANAIPTPLVGTNATTTKHYRGVGLYPFIVEYCDEFQWTMPPQIGGASTYYQLCPTCNYLCDVTVTTFVQIWNMSNVDIISGQLRFVDSNKTGIAVEHNGNNQIAGTLTSFDAIDTAKGGQPLQGILDFGVSPTPTPNPTPAPTPTPTPGPSATSAIPVGTLRANEYKVYKIAQRTYTYDTGSSTDPSRGNSSKFKFGLKTDSHLNSDDTASSYQVYWNSILVDQPPNGLTRTHMAWSPGALPEFHSTMPSLRYSSETTNTAPYLLGDPRGSYYIQASQVDVAYANTSWWGRILMTGSPASTLYANEARTVNWPDGGHNSITPGPSPSGAQPPTSPTPTPFPPLETTKAPARISNAGRFSSITELSYIYDPFQQDPFTSTPGSKLAVEKGWTNAWTNGFNTSSSNKTQYGSHSTLRIGRPEFKTFSQAPTPAPAWQLLDIFSAGDPSPNTNPSTPSPLSNQISTRGKININTASREVLRTLGAGIKMGNLNSSDVDQAIKPSTVYGPISAPSPSATPSAADRLADAIINTRKTQPFISTSQLAQLKATDKNGASSGFFGNANQWLNGDGPTIDSADGSVDWNDAAAEEYFAKLFNFTTVRSRNFRVFVTGQVYIPAGSQPERVIATANRVYHVFLKPARDANGAITSQNCQVTYAADVF